MTTPFIMKNTPSSIYEMIDTARFMPLHIAAPLPCPKAREQKAGETKEHGWPVHSKKMHAHLGAHIAGHPGGVSGYLRAWYI